MKLEERPELFLSQNGYGSLQYVIDNDNTPGSYFLAWVQHLRDTTPLRTQADLASDRGLGNA